MFREHTNNESLGEHSPELTVIGELLGRLTRIEATLEQLLQQKTIKDWYTTDEAAEILGKAPFTVREWCRNRRVKAAKRDCGRGNAREWVISHEELTRVRNEGLLPPGEY